MNVVNYKEAAERIAWQREMKRARERDDALIAVTRRLRCFPPNTALNIKHPWKARERFSIRAWCPLHEGRWVRLIVRAGDGGQLTFECNQGCESDSVATFVNVSTRDPIVVSAETAGNVVYDARNRFRPFEPDAA
jgi:hypothetical protein